MKRKKLNFKILSLLACFIKYKFFPTIMLLLLLVVINKKALGLSHPHIIVKESDYAELQDRATIKPWSVMKAKAINDARNLNYNPSASYSDKCSRTHNIASACALAYILDPDNRSVYVEKVVTQLAQAIDYIRTEKGNKTDHAYHVDPAHASFMMYLVLDIMYNDLSPDIRQAMEDDCDYIADNHRHSWCSSEYSIKAMKELYHNGKTASFESIKNDYHDYILSLTSDDGVYTTGPGYTKSRVFMDSRMQKKIFMDICEYQGYHEFYSDPKFQNLYEWVLGYSVTPFNRTYTFGDSPPTKDLDHWAVSALRVNRFSEKAQRYASWQLGPLMDDKIEGRLLHYILCDSIPKAALRPVSRIFDNGGAWLLEDSDSDRALAGAMWNINTTEDSHNHFDINAIHIAAYGEHVLRNSGYDGYGEPDPITWEWICRTAESSNTVLVDGRNHITWRGGGITEGLVGGDWEYASGSSGYALPTAQHQRNFIFVKPQTGVNHGYFVIIDEVKTPFIWASNSQVNVAWHPNSSSAPVIVEDEKQYRWNIGGCNYSGHNVGVEIFLGSIPDSVEIKTGYLGSYSECSRFQGKYLYSTYNTNGQKEVGVMTVIFPYDDSHPVAEIDRLDISEASGVRIDHGDLIVDHILSITDTSSIRYNEVILKGRAVLFRRHDWNIRSYFVRKGTMFYPEPPFLDGFMSDDEITIHMNGREGQIISSGTDVTFYYPGIKSVIIDDMPAPILDSLVDWVRVHVDSGYHRIRLERKPIGVSKQPERILKEFKLRQNYPNPFNNSTIISYSLPQSDFVELKIYNIHGQEIETIIDGWHSAGEYQLIWKVKELPSGVYLCRLQAGDFSETKKLIFQK